MIKRVAEKTRIRQRSTSQWSIEEKHLSEQAQSGVRESSLFARSSSIRLKSVPNVKNWFESSTFGRGKHEHGKDLQNANK